MQRRNALIARREAVGLSQEGLADEVGVYTSTVARWERGESAPRARQRQPLADALGVDLATLSVLLGPEPPPAAADWGTVLAPSAPAAPASPVLAPLMAALTSYRADGEPLPLDELAAEVAAVRADYQATRYGALVERLPALLMRLPMSTALVGGRMSAVAASAYVTAAGVALKVGGDAAATIAADRAMLAAAASGTPAAIGAGARSVVHALMRAGQHEAAVGLAVAQAAELAGEQDGHTRAVRGALLLRGAVAAAAALDRDASAALVDEAEWIAVRLPPGHDGGGAAFGPINVSLHRVNLALTLGDAGAALAVARTIDVDTIPLVERRAALAIDVARAYTQWGRYEAALDALHLAMRIAPEEVRTRRAVASMVDTLGRAGPPSLRPHVRAYAARMAAAA